MSSKDIIRAGESGGRRAAIREVVPKATQELLPSHIPLPKPTRDISASNRSHSIIHQEAPQPYSDRRILDRDTEEFEYQKQANIVYNRQFKSIAKLLGNQSMDFEQVRQKIEGLLVKDSSNSEADLKYKIQMLEKQLVRKEDQRSSQYLGNSEYIKTMEAQLSRKNKLISQLSESVKKQAFHEAFKELELEVSSKERDVIAMEGQIQEMRVKSATQISTLEEEIIKRNQTIQKTNFELESLKRKLKTHVEQNERAKKREKQLMLSLQTEGKISYQGITYSANSLLKQLQTRDQQIHEMINQHHALEEEHSNLREIITRLNKNLEIQESTINQLNASLEYYKSLTNGQNREIQQYRGEISQLRTNIERTTKDRDLMSELQKREKALVLQCKEYEAEIKSLQFKSQALASQLDELGSRGQADKTLIAQLSSAFSSQKQKYTSTLVNFETIQQKLLEEVQARTRLEAALLQKQQQISNQEAQLGKYNRQRQQQWAELCNERNAFEKQIHLLRRQLQQKNLDVTSLQAGIKQSTQYQREQAQQKERFKQANIILQEEIKHLEIRLAEQNSQLQSYQHKLRIAQQQAELLQSLKSQLEASQLYEAQAGRLKEQLHQEEQQKKALLERCQNLSQVLEEKDELLRTQETNIFRLNSRVEQLARELEHKVTTLQETNRKIHLLEQQLQKKQGALEEKAQLSLQIEQQHESRYRQTITEYAQKILILQRQIAEAQTYRHQAAQLQQERETHQQQLTQLAEDYRRTTLLLDQRIHQQTALEAQLASLKTTLEQKDTSLQHTEPNSQKIVILEQQLYRLRAEEPKLRLMLEEFVEKEAHWENRVENQGVELQQLRIQIQHQKELIERQRVQMQEKLEIMHEQLDREKAQYEEQVQSRHQMEQQFSEMQRLYKQSDFSRQQAEMELTHHKSQNNHLTTRIAELQSLMQDNQINWLQQRQRLTAEIDRLNASLLEKDENIQSNISELKAKHQEQMNIILAKLQLIDDNKHTLQQEKQYLTMTIAELQREKEEIKAQHERGPTLSNDLDNCTFNYYASQEQIANNDTGSRNKEALLERIEELQNQVEQLRQQLEGKSTELVYSKSQEEESLKLMLSSLQEQKHRADIEIQRLKTEQLAKILHQNQALREHIQQLSDKIQTLQQSLLKDNRQSIGHQRSMQTFNTELTSLKESYALTLKDLEDKNQLLLLDLSRFEEKIELLLRENRLYKQESNSEKEQYQRKIEQLETDLEGYKKKEAQMNQELTEINAVLGQIQAMKEQMQSFQQECRQLAAARTELQVRNAQLEAWNNQLQTLLVSQKQDQQQRILSRLSKKSNISAEGENKREHTYSEAPSSDGELSRKILNYDPSKISGQESKFAPHLVFENSKIHVVRESPPSNDPEARAEIKQQRNQESVLSKTLQDRDKSISSSPRQLQDRRSEASRRQTPKQIASSGKEIVLQRPKTNSLKNDESRKHSDSIPSCNNNSELNHLNNIANPDERQQPTPNQAPAIVHLHDNQIQIVAGSSRDAPKEDYLPQHSSKKTIQSNDSKKKEPEQEIAKQSFHKKSHFQTIVPVYTARPSVLQNLQEEQRRDNSGSRSSSRGKITISYGRPDNSIDKKGSKQVQVDERREQSKKSSRISEIGALGISPQISPISIRRPQAYTPTQSLRQSTHKNGQSQIKLLKESIVQPVDKLHSQSIINKVSNISVRFSSVAGGRSSPVEITRPSLPVKREHPQYIPPKIDTVISPRFTTIHYHPIKDNSQWDHKTRIGMTQTSQAKKPELSTNQLQSQSAKTETEKRETQVQQTPIKVSMKRVSSGRRLNSGFADSLTFGARSRKENESMGSSSSDSGIEVMQYDWTAPCCKP